jgi:sulfite reductase alpha subunit-like flavoprotein
MIRNSLYKKIIEALNYGKILIYSDFSINAKDEYESTIVRVTYECGDDDEFFEAKIPNSKSEIEKETATSSSIVGMSTKTYYKTELQFEIELDFSPGILSTHETMKVEGSKKMLEELNNWVIRISEDIKNGVLYRELDNQKKKISEIDNMVKNLPDEYANSEQIDKLKKYIKNLSAKLIDEIKKLKINAKEKEKKIFDLEKQFEVLQERVETTKIKKIFRTLLSRLYQIASDPDLPQLIDNTQETIQNFLPENQ